MMALRGSNPSVARNDTDLPDPLSPTTPTASPGATSRSMPRTACTMPFGVRNVTRRSLRLSTPSFICSPSAVELGVEGVAQAVADEVDADRQQHQRTAREDGEEPVALQHTATRQPDQVAE
jgi:hypothetical protein